MKISKVKKVFQKNFGRVLLAALLMGMCFLNHDQEVRAEYKKAVESELPLSTMKVYRSMDTCS